MYTASKYTYDYIHVSSVNMHMIAGVGCGLGRLKGGILRGLDGLKGGIGYGLGGLKCAIQSDLEGLKGGI